MLLKTIYFLSGSLFLLIVLYFAYNLIHQHLFIPFIFKELQKKYNDKTIIRHSYCRSWLFFTTQFMDMNIYVSHPLFQTGVTEIIARHFRSQSPWNLRITTHPSENHNIIEVLSIKGKPVLFAEPFSQNQALPGAFMPSLQDTLAPIFMMESRRKTAPHFDIFIHKNEIRLEMKAYPRDSHNLLLLTEYVQGVLKELCSSPLVEKDGAHEKKAPSALTSKRYVLYTLSLLILVSLVFLVQMGILLHKKKVSYPPEASYSGTVYTKKIINKNAYYIFIPEKIQITKKDFDSIQEGDKVIKKKGETRIHIIGASENAEQSSEDFLDLLK